MNRFECPKDLLDNIKAMVETNVNLGNIAKNRIKCTIPRGDRTYVIEMTIKSREPTIEESQKSFNQGINKLRRFL